MNTERSNHVVDAYKQDKLNVSVYARIQQLLSQFEAEDEADRNMAWIGVVVAAVLIAIIGYIFLGGSEIKVS